MFIKPIKGLLFVILFLALLWFVFWLFSHKRYAMEYGISFNQNHAADLGLDWKQVYVEMLRDLKPDHVRVAAMWSDVEAVKGDYDFSNVDFMMDQASLYGADVLLVVGQKAPRWPECHVPAWLDYDDQTSREHLLGYVRAVVGRYKDHPALEWWQVENEAFIRFEFGACERYDREAIYEEIALVAELDPGRKIVVTDSGELSTWRLATKAGDIFGTTLYRVVRLPNGMIFNYDWLPAGFYRLKARFWGRTYDDFIISELQAEPWFSGSNPFETPVDVQEKTMNPERLGKHIDYAERVGAHRAYFWGVEWWYFMKKMNNDARYWDMARETLND